MFVIENAKEIMFLCFGVGFLGVSIYLMRSLYLVTRLVKKVDDITDLIIEYIQKPLSILLQVHKTVMKFKNFFRKK